MVSLQYSKVNFGVAYYKAVFVKFTCSSRLKVQVFVLPILTLNAGVTFQLRLLWCAINKYYMLSYH